MAMEPELSREVSGMLKPWEGRGGEPEPEEAAIAEGGSMDCAEEDRGHIPSPFAFGWAAGTGVAVAAAAAAFGELNAPPAGASLGLRRLVVRRRAGEAGGSGEPWGCWCWGSGKDEVGFTGFEGSRESGGCRLERLPRREERSLCCCWCGGLRGEDAGLLVELEREDEKGEDEPETESTPVVGAAPAGELVPVLGRDSAAADEDCCGWSAMLLLLLSKQTRARICAGLMSLME